MIHSKYRYLAACFLNERRSLDELQALQSKKLRRLVKYAYEYVPFYRDLYDRAGVHPDDIRSVADIVKLPIIDKNDLRNAQPGMWMDRRAQNKDKLVRIITSGSSGSPLEFYITRQCDHIRKAQFLRPLITNGRGLFDSLVRLTYRDEIPFKWFQKIGLLREYRISVLKSAEEKIERIIRIKPDILYGYPSMLNELAHEIRGRGIHYTPKLIFTDSELLLSSVRAFISETFQADVIDIYGTYEIDNVAYECREHRGYHIAIDHVVMEFIRNGIPAAAGNEAEIVCTVLDNFTMPFIRYNLHDIAGYSDEKCLCGRTFPLMHIINGREGDYITRGRGEKIPFTGLIIVFSEQAGNIKEYQIVQESITQLRINIVPTQQYNDPVGEKIVAKFRELFPEMNIALSVCPAIARERSGKLKVFKSFIT